MSIVDKFIDREKAAKATIASPREIFYNALRQTSGSAFTRELRFDIFYQIIAFRGVVEGVGTSTLVANTALALSDLGLSICVVDTSILNPVQDILLKTDEAVDITNDGKEHLDWFDMPYTKKSCLHISKLKKNISVLSFRGKKRGIIDVLSTNDSDTLVEIAFTELHNKFDLILVDTCHELSCVNAAALQQSQQVIQVWNDTPTVIGNLENFITNSITISCPLDKMRYVVYNKIVKDVIGNLDELIKQYRLNVLAKSYMSEELLMLIVTGKTLYQAASTDEGVIEYTNCIIDIACHILNIHSEDEPHGTITSQDIMDGKVEGTYHKELKDYNDKFVADHPEVVIETNPLANEQETMQEPVPDAEVDDGFTAVETENDFDDFAPSQDMTVTERITGKVYASNDETYNTTLEEAADGKHKKKGLFGKKKKDRG